MSIKNKTNSYQFSFLRKPYGSSNRSPVAQVTRSIPHDEMEFSDCTRIENCLYDLSSRADREADFPDRLSLSNVHDGS